MNIKKFKKEMKKFKIDLLDYFLNCCLYIFSVEIKPSQELIGKFLNDNTFSDVKEANFFVKKLGEFYNNVVSFLDLDFSKKTTFVNNVISELLKGHSNDKIKNIFMDYIDKFIGQIMNDYEITNEMLEKFNHKEFTTNLIHNLNKSINEIDYILFNLSYLMILSGRLALNENFTLKEFKEILFEIISVAAYLNLKRKNNFKF